MPHGKRQSRYSVRLSVTLVDRDHIG